MPSNPRPTSGVTVRRAFTNSTEAAMTYIHYVTEHFDPALFVPIRNGGLEYGFRPKPADGTGLWASREGDPDGWEA